MIIKIDLSPNIKNTLEYNFEKCNTIEADGSPSALLLESSNYIGFGRSPKFLLEESRDQNRNPRIKQKFLHIKVSINPNENLSNLEFLELANDVLKGLDFEVGLTHNLVFKHNDTNHPHIHIAVSRTNILGETNPLSFYKYKAVTLARTLEKKYNLSPAFDQKLDQQGIRVKSWTEDKVENSTGRQSKIQAVRDIVTDSLKQSSKFQEYIFNLHRNGVAIRFRLEKKEDEKVLIGLSYKLSSQVGVKFNNPDVPVC